MEKFYGYGIVDKDGLPMRRINDIKAHAEGEARRLNQSSDYALCAPYRVVELFYKDGQP